MASYQFSTAAIQDLKNICDYIAQTNPRAASRLFDAMRQKCKLIANFPNMGKSYHHLRPHLRGFVVSNYIIFYYPNDDGIAVARVLSGYQDLQSLLETDPF